MKKYILFTSVVLFSPCISSLAQAAQCAINDCAYLGYTETQNKGNCLQCPFGDYWFCPNNTIKTCDSKYAFYCNRPNEEPSRYTLSCNGRYEKCDCKDGGTWNTNTLSCTCTSDYRYDCTGAHEIPDYDYNACGGKYAKCRCETGYGWSSSSGACVSMGETRYYIATTECYKASVGVVAKGTASKVTCSLCSSVEKEVNKTLVMTQFNSGNDEQDMRDCISYVDSYRRRWFADGSSCYYDTSCQ